MSDPAPDQFASGSDHETGQEWAIARYGTLIVVTLGEDEDDHQLPDVAAAEREFAQLQDGLPADQD